MHASRRAPRVLAVFIASVFVITGSVFGGSAATAVPTTSPRPTVMAALGDSITQAIMTCSSLSSCAANSWSTGTSASVNSHAARLRALTPTQPLTTYNNAVSSVTSSALPGQAAKAVAQGAQYVTIEIGANDACTKTVGAMTLPATYKANIDAALAALAANGSNREIFVASIPNLQRMYDLNKGSSSARFTWTVLGLCQSLLASPSSTRAADVQRRAAVQTRVNEYNAVLAASCAATPKCRFDGGAVANTVFERSHISTRDYFHPSVSGQALLANITWPKTQWVS